MLNRGLFRKFVRASKNWLLLWSIPDFMFVFCIFCENSNDPVFVLVFPLHSCPKNTPNLKLNLNTKPKPRTTNSNPASKSTHCNGRKSQEAHKHNENKTDTGNPVPSPNTSIAVIRRAQWYMIKLKLEQAVT